MSQWYAIYSPDTGRLISTGTVVAGIHDDATLPDGLDVVAIDGPPDGTIMWDESLRQMVPRPPKTIPPLPPKLKAIIDSLTPAEHAVILRYLSDIGVND